MLEGAGEASGVMLAVGRAVALGQATVHLQALSILQMGLWHERNNSFKVRNHGSGTDTALLTFLRPGPYFTPKATRVKAICFQTHSHSSRRASKIKSHL